MIRKNYFTVNGDVNPGIPDWNLIYCGNKVFNDFPTLTRRSLHNTKQARRKKDAQLDGKSTSERIDQFKYYQVNRFIKVSASYYLCLLLYCLLTIIYAL